MIALRREHAALRRGETIWVASSGPERVVSFVRRGGGEDVLVAVNLSSQPWTGVPLPQQPGGGTPERAARKAELPALALDAWGFRVFRRPLG
jgi:glycosidase